MTSVRWGKNRAEGLGCVAYLGNGGINYYYYCYYYHRNLIIVIASIQ